MDFLKRVNPDTQASFALHPVKAVTGDYPTLSELCDCYGKEAASAWLVPQLADMTMFTGAQNLKEKQQEQLADILAVEGRGLKVTELMLFFYRFKAGCYERFYSRFDPQAILSSLRMFIQERARAYDARDEELRRRKDAEHKAHCISYEEYCKRNGFAPEHHRLGMLPENEDSQQHPISPT